MYEKVIHNIVSDYLVYPVIALRYYLCDFQIHREFL